MADSDRNDERRDGAQDEPQDGPVGGRAEASQVQPEESVLTMGGAATGGTGTDALGVAGQRHEGGSSRDSEKLGEEK